MLLFNFIDAGDVVAAALPNFKCLRKVSMCDMNPVAVLQTVGLCRRLQEVSVEYPKHCEVGMRCAYRCMQDVCSHSVPDSKPHGNKMARREWGTSCFFVFPPTRCYNNNTVHVYLSRYHRLQRLKRRK